MQPAYPSFELVATLDGHPPKLPQEHVGAMRFKTAVAFSPNGNQVAEGDWGGGLRIWDAGSGQLLKTLSGAGSVTFLEFSPDGSLLAAPGSRGKVLLFELATGRVKHELPGTDTCLAFHPKGRFLATTNQANLIGLWDVSTGKSGKIMDAQDQVCSLTFLPASLGGPVLLSHEAYVLAAGTSNGQIKIWNPETGKLMRTLEGHSGKVTTLVPWVSSFDGIVSLGEDGVRSWFVNKNTSAVEPQRIFEARGGGLAIVNAHNDVGVGTEDGKVRFLDLNSGQELKMLQAHTKKIEMVRSSGDGQFLATVSYDESLKIWRLK